MRIEESHEFRKQIFVDLNLQNLTHLHFRSVTGWGEKYDELVELTGYEAHSLAVYATVARKFNQEFRKDLFIRMNKSGVSFGHFAIVASLDLEVAKYLLQRAGEAGKLYAHTKF